MKAIVRGDLDGIVSAALLKAINQVDEMVVVQIKDIVDGKIDITDQDIICNLPYHPDCYLWFDHHTSEARKTPPIPINFQGAFALADSTARVVYDYFLPFHPKLEKYIRLVEGVDKVDRADLTEDDVLNPRSHVMLGFLLDPRSRMAGDGENRLRYEKWRAGIPDLLIHEGIEDILSLQETQHWVKVYMENQAAAMEVYRKTTRLEGNIIYSDFRGLTVPPANRFIIYSMPEFSAGNITVQVSDGEPDVWYEISIGHSIFNKTSMVDVGDLCSWYGGGGHRAVGVCRPSSDDVEQVLSEVLHACQGVSISHA